MNTHHHFDHFGRGSARAVAQSATIITHPINKDFYQNVLLYPSARTLQPDIMSRFYPWASFNRTPSSRAGRPEVRVERRHANDGDTPVTQLAHTASMLHRVSAGREDPDQRRPVSPPAPGATPPATPESKHGEPETQYPGA